jgi:hypothetical protein
MDLKERGQPGMREDIPHGKVHRQRLGDEPRVPLRPRMLDK